MLTDPDRARFLAKLSPPNANGCREWMGRRDKDGYGVFDLRNPKRTVRCTHVVLIGDGHARPEGGEACHTCDNPPCCEGSHLYWGSHSDNMKDRARRGRQAGGVEKVSKGISEMVRERMK